MNVARPIFGHVQAPWGFRGGDSGRTAKSRLVRHNGEEIELPSMLSARLTRAGDRFIAIGGSGGGYGPPRERNPRDVLRDYLDGFVTRNEAKNIYEVVIDHAGGLDMPATESMRAVNNRE